MPRLHFLLPLPDIEVRHTHPLRPFVLAEVRRVAAIGACERSCTRIELGGVLERRVRRAWPGQRGVEVCQRRIDALSRCSSLQRVDG